MLPLNKIRLQNNKIPGANQVEQL
uniref:Uncharacterized protein n=1 Tax=Arundo donax TaxID=35708 RepID=A0A0A8YD75_ARUDO